MVKVPMTTDIKDFSPKVISIFNKRQLICTAIALSYGFPLIMYARALDLNTRMTLATILMLPVKVYGMPLERFAMIILVNHVLTPTRRAYATKSAMGYLGEDSVVLFRGAKRKKMTWKEKKARRQEMKKYGGVK